MVFLGTLRQAQGYVRSLESGFTVFDLKSSAVAIDAEQWEPILDWLRPIAGLASAAAALPAPLQDAPPERGPMNPLRDALASSLKPAQESLLPGQRLSVFGAANTAAPEITAQTHAVNMNKTFRHVQGELSMS
ncbi:hypothetical protein GALL_511400 [mine drainage metagenome]|uniref:Uncharacterized protein n=1 Tax=mine drainage metagenome TaxID=410659 RepID=A0A1J5PIB9_9ZZZZ